MKIWPQDVPTPSPRNNANASTSDEALDNFAVYDFIGAFPLIWFTFSSHHCCSCEKELFSDALTLAPHHDRKGPRGQHRMPGPHSTQIQHRLLDTESNSLQIAAIMINATPAQLRKAADIQEKIQSLQKELGQLLAGEVSAPTQPAKAPKKGKMSAAGRAAIRAAQLARWAKIKGTAKPAKKAKKKMSAQGLANIRAGVAKRMAAQGKAVQKPKIRRSAAWRAAVSAAAKARWAKVKAAGKSRL
jgi:hypothetical protein